MNFFSQCPQIAPEEFAKLRKGAKVLEADRRGEKVLLTTDDRIVKLFYPRRQFSSAAIHPYAMRFWKNSRKLRLKNITSVACSAPLYDPQYKRHLISYPIISGETLRDTIANTKSPDQHIDQLVDFLVTIHQKGILFRSVHLGNILRLDNGTLGLIDIADMSVQKHPLNLIKRARNFRHLLHDPRDRDKLEQYGYQKVLQRYEEKAGIKDSGRSLFRLLVNYFAPAMKPSSRT